MIIKLEKVVMEMIINNLMMKGNKIKKKMIIKNRKKLITKKLKKFMLLVYILYILADIEGDIAKH